MCVKKEKNSDKHFVLKKRKRITRNARGGSERGHTITQYTVMQHKIAVRTAALNTRIL